MQHCVGRWCRAWSHRPVTGLGMMEGSGPAWRSLACPGATSCRAVRQSSPVRGSIGFSIRYQGLLLKCKMSGRVGSRSRAQAQASERAQLDALSLSSLLLTLSGLDSWFCAFRVAVQGDQGMLWVPCTVFRGGPRLLHISFWSLSEFLLLKVISFQ